MKNRFQLTPVSAATAATATLLLLNSSLALAQPAPAAGTAATETQTVTVSGQRQALEKAEQTKRESDQVVDAINASDIGKFPDKSLGEAMQRIPGVQISRERGEATQVLIRGLPDLVTTINGNDVFTGRGRRLSTQDLPVQAIQGIQVFKSGSAEQLEGGIAGLLNVQLRKPFDQEGLTANAYGDLHRVSPRGTQAKTLNNYNVGGLFSNRVKTDKGEIGFLFDATLIKDDYNNPTQWVDMPDRVWAVEANGNARRLEDDQIGPDGKYKTPPGTRLASLPHMGGVYNAGKRDRNMAHAALQWKPSAELEVNSQLLYTGYRSKWEEDFIFTITGWAPTATGVRVAPDGDYCNSKFGRICPVVAATVQPIPNGVDPFTATSTQAHKSQTDTVYGSLGLNWRLGNMTWGSDLSLVRSKFEDDRIIVDQSIFFPTVTLATDVGGHGTWSVATPTSSAALKDPKEFRLRGLFQSFQSEVGQQVAWRNDLNWKLDSPVLRNASAGMRLASHTVSNHSADGGRDVPNPDNRQAPNAAFGESFSNLVPGIDRIGGSFVTPSADFLRDNADRVRAYYGARLGRLPEDPNRFFDQTERSAAVYGQLKTTFDIGGIDVRGVAGLRAVRTDRSLSGKSTFDGVVRDITQKSSSTDVLPMLSAVLGWTDSLQSHLSIGKAIRRPEFADLNPAVTATPPTPNRPGYANGGNPDLKPVESINTDLTLEYYFKKNGYVSVAAFHRKVDGYIQGFAKPETIDGLLYDVSRPNNSGRGTVRGFELAAQKFFDFLPDPFNGLGGSVNFTQITGNNQRRTTLNGADFIDDGFPGVSKQSYNAALMFDKNGFNARLALTHRGAYAEALSTGRFGFDNRVRASNWVDFSGGYDVTRNLAVWVQALNLSKESYRSYQGDEIRPRDIRYGSTVFSLGLRVRL